jgi:hypothetical protein
MGNKLTEKEKERFEREHQRAIHNYLECAEEKNELSALIKQLEDDIEKFPYNLKFKEQLYEARLISFDLGKESSKRKEQHNKTRLGGI